MKFPNAIYDASVMTKCILMKTGSEVGNSCGSGPGGVAARVTVT